MAVVHSHTQSGGRGSLGSTYFSNRYGRTIQSQKPGPRRSAATRGDSKGSAREQIFGMISQFMAAHSADINKDFNKVRYGSARNYFHSQNKDALRLALTPLVDMSPSLSQIEDAIGTYAKTNPNSIYRVKRTGADIKFLKANWAEVKEDEDII